MLRSRNNIAVPKGVQLIKIPVSRNVMIDFGVAVVGPGPATDVFGRFLLVERSEGDPDAERIPSLIRRNAERGSRS